jgi:hypothetical protein
MDLNKFRLLTSIALIALFSYAGFAQDQMFTDPAVEYSFTVPDTGWKTSVRPSSTNPNVEYVYGDRRDGHLVVRKRTVSQNAIMADVIQDEAQSFGFKRGYVAGKEENFTGKLKGSAFNYEYVDVGRPMAGRVYFLRANPTTVYVLHFTGPKDGLRSLRSQTDQIARTFGVK